MFDREDIQPIYSFRPKMAERERERERERELN